MRRTFHEYRTHEPHELRGAEGCPLSVAVTVGDFDSAPERYNVTASFQGTLAMTREDLVDFCDRVLAMDREIRAFHPLPPGAAASTPVGEMEQDQEIPF